LCNKHYREQRVETLGPYASCSVEGCTRPTFVRDVCLAHYQKFKRELVWQEIIELKGGKCNRCEGTYPYVVYDLHHRDPSKKTRAFGTQFVANMSSEVRAELDGCDLLCANCHRIITYLEEENVRSD
jgi:hypothetical protein